VHWYGTGDQDGEGACHNREEAAAFIRRVLADGLSAELRDVREAGDRLVAVIHTHATPGWERGSEPQDELVTIRDGKVTEMVVYPTVEEALAAAGRGERPCPKSGGSSRTEVATGRRPRGRRGSRTPTTDGTRMPAARKPLLTQHGCLGHRD
jgi:hypothetical protein